MTSSADVPLVFLVAGEASSDLIGARLMRILKRRCGGAVRFDGIGGTEMASEGLTSRFPMGELSLVGLAEVVPHIPGLLRRMWQVARIVARRRPAVVLFIDASGFSRLVARRLRGRGIPLVQYKAPQAWAYWPWRARTMARFFDHVFTILPFEPEFFAGYGLSSTFIGHPAIESGAASGDGPAFRDRHGIPAAAPLLCLLPGSRWSETKWSLPVFGATLARLVDRVPDLRAVVPTIEPVAETVAAAVAKWPARAITIPVQQRYDAFAASDVALAVSGTVSAELAVAGLPMVITNRLPAFSAAIVRRIALVDHVSVANLVLDRAAVPELLQELCRPDSLAEACGRLLLDLEARAAQSGALREAAALLGRGGAMPTERAAEILLRIIAKRR
jgi:lipid-A-disaccharide synthase